jgi:hypothetical protein
VINVQNAIEMNFAPLFEADPTPVELFLNGSGIQEIKLPQVIEINGNDTFQVSFENLPKYMSTENNQLFVNMS